MPVFIGAWLFAFQLLLGSLALGMSAASATPLDAFGNPLCITHPQGASDDGRKDGPKLPECCTQACGMFAPAIAPEISGHFLDNRLEAFRAPLLSGHDAGPLGRQEADPGHPRGPPQAG